MILNGKVANPGEMRTRIELLRRTVTTESGGFQHEGTPELIAEVWAKRTNVHGSEVWAAQAAGAIEPVTWLIRYRDDVDETCLIRVKGETKLHEIISTPDNIQARDEYLEIKTKRVVVT